MKNRLTGLALIAALGGCATLPQATKPSPQQQDTVSSGDFFRIPSPTMLFDYLRSNGIYRHTPLDDGSSCDSYSLETTVDGRDVGFRLGSCHGNGFESYVDRNNLVINGKDENGLPYFINFAGSGPAEHFLLQAKVRGFDYSSSESPEARARIEKAALKILKGLEQNLF